MKRFFYLLIIAVLASCTNETNEATNFPLLTGDYLGQNLPGDSAFLFAPDIVSTGNPERDIVITPDGKEIFFVRSVGQLYSTLLHSKMENGKWLKPKVFKFCADSRYRYLEPFVTADGEKLFFVSNKPINGEELNSFDIWISEKNENNEWSEPYNIGAPINTDQNDFFPTVTSDGNLYYTSMDTILKEEFIYKSKFINGKYTKPEKLHENVNGGRARFNATIAKDESYIIVPTFGTPEAPRTTNYFIVFRDENDRWSKPINMEQYLNSGGGWSASLSPDNKFLFFMSSKVHEIISDTLSLSKINKLYNSPQNGNSDIYWIKADFIEELRKKAEF